MITLTHNDTGGGWRLWFAWVVATSLGWLLALLLGDLLGERVAGVLARALLGAVVGVLQWLVLRPYLPRAGWWVAATSLGVAGGILASAVLVAQGGGVDGGSGSAPGMLEVLRGLVVRGVQGAVFGAVLGVLQWLVLQRHRPRAGWWVLVSSLGWALGSAVLVEPGGFLVSGLMGAVAGASTGLGLVWLLRSPDA